MIDALQAIRDFLLADAALTALVSTRVFAGRDVPPRGVQPGDGALITFRIRGGAPDYENALLWPSVQIKCYGATEYTAEAVYRTLYDALQCARGEQVLHAELETLGGQLEEPETGWFFTVSYWRLLIRMDGDQQRRQYG